MTRSTGDKYVRATVILASVLFLVGISTHFPLPSVTDRADHRRYRPAALRRDPDPAAARPAELISPSARQHDDLVHPLEPLAPVRDQQHRAVAGASRTSSSSASPSARRGARSARRARAPARPRAAPARRRSAARWPPESSRPCSPTSVSSPSGSSSTQSQIRARRSASSISASPALGPREPDVLADRGREQVRVLAGDGDRAADVLLAELAQVSAAERHPALPRDRGSGAAGSRPSSCRRRSGRRSATRRPGSSRRLNAVEHRRLAGRVVASADALERDRDRAGRELGRRLPGRAPRGSRSVSSTSRPPGRERLGQLARRLGERLNRLERREREQRERRDQHAVEPVRRRGPRRRARARPRRSRPSRAAGARRRAPSANAARAASDVSAAVGGAEPVEPPRLRDRRRTARRAPASSSTSSADSSPRAAASLARGAAAERARDERDADAAPRRGRPRARRPPHGRNAAVTATETAAGEQRDERRHDAAQVEVLQGVDVARRRARAGRPAGIPRAPPGASGSSRS